MVAFSGRKVGGTRSTSRLVLNELKIIMRKGSRVKERPSVSIKYIKKRLNSLLQGMACVVRAGEGMAAMLILPIRAQHAHLENRHAHDDQEQHEGLRRRPAHVLVAECVLVDVKHQHLRLVVGVAVGPRRGY